MDIAANAIAEVAKCSWESLAEPISYIYNPTKNLKSLEDELQRLASSSADVKKKVEDEEVTKGGTRTQQVGGWLNNVQQLEVESHQLIQEGKSYQQKSLVWFSPTNYRSSYKLGKRVNQLLGDVKERQTEGGKFDALVIRLPPQVREMPMEDTVGLDSMLSQVWNWLNERNIGIIGLWGMGGVGKTTLLRKINEEFRRTSLEFKVVWITVSKQVNYEKIRERIWEDLEIGGGVWSNRSEDAKASQLYSALNRKKFVLLIDDTWERLDLVKIGIPIPNPINGSKIVLTTRSESVCGQMKVDKRLKVQCLSLEQALQLFEANVGEDALNSHPSIPKYAKEIAEECKGLPLALITIGRAMSSMKTLDDWSRALRVLRNYPIEFSEIVDVYKLLSFSYDRLDSLHKKCFLYCALFPEDHEILINDLIELWMGEGFLGETNDTDRAWDKGVFTIRNLKSACLLEEGRDSEEIKMHDVIRDMALWLARDQGKNENKIIAPEQDVSISSWKEAERVSLRGPRITHVTKSPVCSNLVTLRINGTKLETLPEEFFDSMKVLRVLDMSRNRKFKKLPTGVRRLVNLQYLNLSKTSIEVLPDELKYLTSLVYLLLDDTEHLVNIPKEVISSLSSLKVFRKTEYSMLFNDERGLIEGLEGLNQLDELSLRVSTAFNVQKLLLQSSKFQSIITELTIDQCSDLTDIRIPTSSLRKMLRLNGLRLTRCDSLESMEIYEDGESMIPMHVNDRLSRGSELTNLHQVIIFSCQKLRNLSWLIYAPNLQEVNVGYCSALEKIIDEDILQHVDKNASTRLFSSLRFLDLRGLPELRSIHNRTLSSPSLTGIMIGGCPRLKKLPFDSNSGKNNLERVRATHQWWSGLEWDDEAAKDFFTSKLI